MSNIADKIMDHKRCVLLIFGITIIMCLILSKTVLINYDLKSYLPDDSPSTISNKVMEEEFTRSTPNSRVLVRNVTIPESLEYKSQIEAVSGVDNVQWMDDITNIYQPLEVIPDNVFSNWYKENNALFQVTISEADAGTTIGDIKKIIGEDNEITGEIVDLLSAKENTGSESGKMLFFIVPFVLFILFLTTSSFFEPVLFMIAMVVAIVLNSGTNAFLGEISFITKTTSSILQLAVSMDYSIFLLHRFSEYRQEGEEVKTAMIHAMKKAFSSILASGLTTVMGFGALIVMRFKIGPDLGIVLAKGILFSILSVMILLPVLTVYTYKIIDKTHHKSFVPPFFRFGKLSIKMGIPVMVLVAILIVPAFLAQRNNDFMYGASFVSEGDLTDTELLFGKANNLVLLVPKGETGKEEALAQELLNKPYVSNVISYSENVGITVPYEYIPKDTYSALESDQYSRLVMTLSTEQEGNEAFQAVEEIRVMAGTLYGDDYYLTGGTPSIYDMRNTVIQDNKLVAVISIIGIGLTILFTFRSLLIPFILLLTIEASVWINLSVPYFADEKMVYIGFMIISSVQLGATVDYAILFASRYIENRRILRKKKAAIKTISDTTVSILTSASILTAAGFIMGAVSTNGVIGQLGTLIGRGTMLSATMVLFFLPMALVIFDKPIQKTTIGLDFLEEDSQDVICLEPENKPIILGGRDHE